MAIKNKVRIIKCESTHDKTIYTRDPKKKYKRNSDKLIETVITVRDDCNLITNLPKKKIYNDTRCLEIYKSRWDIEVFF